MKTLNTRLALAAAAVSAATLIPSAQAQTAPLYIIAGSSAIFNTLGYANFELNSSSSYLTGPNHWSAKSGSAISAGSGCTGGTFSIVIHDSRSSNIVDEPGNVWVAWNADEVASPKGPNPKLSAYISVDSTVGVRAALAVPAATLSIGAPAGTCGANVVPNTSVPDSPLPAAVLADLNATPAINLAAADIRFEDAKFATSRTLTAQGTQVGGTTRTNVLGLGYGGAFGPSIGYPIKSSRSSTTANPVDFALFGTDPISGAPADANIVALPLGAGPVVVFVNTTNTGAGHFGDSTLTDIDEWPLTGLVSGKLHRTRDAFHPPVSSSLGDFPARVFLREPLSGTYNVFEYNIPNTVRELTTQEVGVTNVTPASGSAQNPLNEQIADNGGFAGRSRAIGTGEEVKAVAAVPDSLGYAFWGYGNFAGYAPTTLRYLSVNGVDPLFSSYSANPISPGALPQKSGSSYPVIPFPHIADGSYPIWTTFRLVLPNVGASLVANAQALVSTAQADSTLISDFIPFPSLGVFRSHYFQAQIGPYNGHKTGFTIDTGGDVGGAILPIQEDLDTILDGAGENYQLLQ